LWYWIENHSVIASGTIIQASRTITDGSSNSEPTFRNSPGEVSASGANTADMATGYFLG
jgi:hypothetical protein